MTSQYKKAFTMLELVFVIVVIGILSAIAIPKFALTRNDAVITKAKVAVAALRSALATERQKKILKGEFDRVDGAALESLMEYGLGTGWTRSGDTFTFSTTAIGSCAFTIHTTKNKLEKGTCNITDMSDL